MSKRPIMTLSLMSICLLVGIVSFAWGHGGAAHIMGTVTDVTQEQLIIQTIDKKNVTITLTPTTQYKPVGKNTRGLIPKVGDRVVVEATNSSGNLSANEIRFSSVSLSQQQ